MGDAGKGVDEDRFNVKGAGGALQVNSTVGFVIWEKELSSDGGHTINTRGIPLSVSHMDCGDDGAAYRERRVGVTFCG